MQIYHHKFMLHGIMMNEVQEKAFTCPSSLPRIGKDFKQMVEI
jgi:hypothetical protein